MNLELLMGLENNLELFSLNKNGLKMKPLKNIMNSKLPAMHIDITNLNIEHITKYYSNGQKKYMGSYVSYHPVLNHSSWYENGNKKSEGFYQGLDKRYGRWNFWHSNGHLACTAIYKDKLKDTPILWTFWDEKGNKAHEHKYNQIQLSCELGILGELSKFTLDGCSKRLMKKYEEYIFFTRRP